MEKLRLADDLRTGLAGVDDQLSRSKVAARSRRYR